jgi:hypothetical protein
MERNCESPGLSETDGALAGVVCNTAPKQSAFL